MIEKAVSQVRFEIERIDHEMQKLVIAALRRTGIADPDPEEIAQYLSGRENQHWAPI